MKLYELAYCCRLYGHLTGYDRHLSQLHQQVGSNFDPAVPGHRAALFQWLNGWGCRQFAKQHHTTTASDSLVTWATSWLGNLPTRPEQLTDLSAASWRSALAPTMPCGPYPQAAEPSTAGRSQW
jgi:hypothetical protein